MSLSAWMSLKTSVAVQSVIHIQPVITESRSVGMSFLCETSDQPETLGVNGGVPFAPDHQPQKLKEHFKKL